MYNLLRTEKDASKEQNKDQINSLKMTHQDLANMVGSSRETVTRALNRLQDEGVISISHQQISVLDLDKLSESQDE